MKLSEAILLGSTVVTPKAGRQYFPENQAGCALGMAAIARRCSFRRVIWPFPWKDRRTRGTEGVWGDWVLHVVMRPCPCWRLRVPREMRIKDIIAHIFDYHVMKKRNWTLDQLAKWVQTVEPKNYDTARTIDPKHLERISQLLTARKCQTANESQREEFKLDYQGKTNLITARHVVTEFPKPNPFTQAWQFQIQLMRTSLSSKLRRRFQSRTRADEPNGAVTASLVPRIPISGIGQLLSRWHEDRHLSRGRENS
jgi:hypothetical protein